MTAARPGAFGVIRARRSAYSRAAAKSPASRLKLMSASRAFAIIGMARQDLFQNGHGFVFATRGMQPDGVDISISRPLGIEFGRRRNSSSASSGRFRRVSARPSA